MIEIASHLGKKKLSKYNLSEDRKKAFLDSQTIIPRSPTSPDKQPYNEFVINLDIKNNSIKLDLGKELTPDNREQFFAFELLGKRSKKIYFSTNNLYYHLTSINEAISYIESKFSDQFQNLLKYLIDLRDRFYVKSDNDKWHLNFNKLIPHQKSQFFNYLNAESKFSKKKGAFNELASKDIYGESRKNFVKSINIFCLKINDEYIHQTNWKEDYINLVYYERNGRFFESSEPMVQETGICSMCGNKTKVTGKIDIPTKFYITEKETFFEGVNKKSAYKSFALDETCYQEIMTGIDHIQMNYHNRLVGNDYYIIPKNDDSAKLLEENDYLLKDYFNSRVTKLHKKLLDTVGGTLKLNRRQVRFDFLFFWLDQASFNVLDEIPDVKFRQMDEIIKTLHEASLFYTEWNIESKITDLYRLLFPNSYSHGKIPDANIYRKEFIQLIKSFLKGYSISYSMIIRQFLDIYSKTYFRTPSKKRSGLLGRTLKLHVFLKAFNRHAKLQNLKNMETKKPITELPEDLNFIHDFFENHNEIYGQDSHKQGLVLLGYLMNQILYKQNKESKSSTIVDKINFEGMPVRRMPHFISEITGYLKNYGQYHFNAATHAAMMDRLTGIENSHIKNHEVVFYLLTGLSLGRYIGIRESKNKKSNNKEQNNE